MIKKSKKIKVIKKIHKIESEAGRCLFERGDMLHLLSLSLIAKINCLFLGVPGTAKTLAVKTVAQSFCDDKNYFDILMSKTTKPDELFGSLDIKALTDRGEQIRLIDGYSPTAKVAVFDEMWKGSAAILNTLLTLSNEHKYKNGNKWIDCPLRFAVGMSNEFPEEPALLAALFDRFPIKLMVHSINEDSNFKAMLSNGGQNIVTKLTDDDLDELDQLISNVAIPDTILDSVCGIRFDLKSKGVEISDRRWYQSVKVMKAEAVYNDRKKIIDSDLLILNYIAWNQESEQSIIKSILPQYAAPVERELRGYLEEVYSEREKVISAWNKDGEDSSRTPNDAIAAASAGMAAVQKITKITNQVMILLSDVDTNDDKIMIDKALDEIGIICDKVKNISLGIRGNKTDIMAELSATIKS